MAVLLHRIQKRTSVMSLFSCFVKVAGNFVDYILIELDSYINYICFVYLSIKPYFTFILSNLSIIGSDINQRKNAVDAA